MDLLTACMSDLSALQLDLGDPHAALPMLSVNMADARRLAGQAQGSSDVMTCTVLQDVPKAVPMPGDLQLLSQQLLVGSSESKFSAPDPSAMLGNVTPLDPCD